MVRCRHVPQALMLEMCGVDRVHLIDENTCGWQCSALV